MHGKVERKIKEIKKSIEKSYGNERLSHIQWETVVAEVANTINNLPLALGNTTSDFEIMDLITPNRLLLGRNNERSPIGSLKVTSNLDKIIKLNNKIFDCWFENWLTTHVPKLMYQPKWFESSKDIQVGDIVLFLKHDSKLSKTYQYGMVKEVELSSDGLIRKVHIKYQNYNENVERGTFRSTRELVIIHRIDEIDIIKDLGEIAVTADANYNYEYGVKV